jgi:hypothetical protein
VRYQKLGPRRAPAAARSWLRSVPTAGLARALAAGATFTNRTASAPWSARFSHTSVVDAAGAIYVIGGFGHLTGWFHDVWVSTDGGARPDSGVVVRRGVHWMGTRGVLAGY